jgi:hypothetical protein
MVFNWNAMQPVAYRGLFEGKGVSTTRVSPPGPLLSLSVESGSGAAEVIRPNLLGRPQRLHELLHRVRAVRV